MSYGNEHYRVFPTHTNLIHFKQRHNNSVKGLNLLKRKRDVLLIHHKEILEEKERLKKDVTEIFNEAIMSVNRAKFLDVNLYPLWMKGYDNSFAKGSLLTRTKNIVGILIPQISYNISHHKDDNNNSLAGLGKGREAILNIRKKFIEFISILVQISSILLADNKIQGAIQQTSTRINALELLIIPRTIATVSYIKAELEEGAREDFYRIKRMLAKKKLSAQQSNLPENFERDESKSINRIETEDNISYKNFE